jgi:Rod binding domain-containing protein
LGGQFERGIYEDLFAQEVAREGTKEKGLGVGDLLYRFFVESLNLEEEGEDGTDRGNPIRSEGS